MLTGFLSVVQWGLLFAILRYSPVVRFRSTSGVFFWFLVMLTFVSWVVVFCSVFFIFYFWKASGFTRGETLGFTVF